MTNGHVEEGTKGTGTLVDFFYSVEEGSQLMVEVTVKDDGKCAIFYNKPFKHDPAWIEFNLGTSRLDFVLEDGETRHMPLAFKDGIARHMQNTHQMLMILLDDDTGVPKEGTYVPLILHTSE